MKITQSTQKRIQDATDDKTLLAPPAQNMSTGVRRRGKALEASNAASSFPLPIIISAKTRLKYGVLSAVSTLLCALPVKATRPPPTGLQPFEIMQGNETVRGLISGKSNDDCCHKTVTTAAQTAVKTILSPCMPAYKNGTIAFNYSLNPLGPLGPQQVYNQKNPFLSMTPANNSALASTASACMGQWAYFG